MLNKINTFEYLGYTYAIDNQKMDWTNLIHDENEYLLRDYMVEYPTYIPHLLFLENDKETSGGIQLGATKASIHGLKY